MSLDICIYCGEKADTRDHIPPKRIFPKPRPTNLITVPSCRGCNQSFQLDDEYFDVLLSISELIEKNKSVEKRKEKLLRNLSRSGSIRLLQMILNSMEKHTIVNERGEELIKYSYKIDFERINSLVARVVRGIFYNHMQFTLSSEYSIKVKELDDLLDHTNLEGVEATVQVFNFICNGPLEIVDKDVFSYRYLFVNEDHIFGGCVIDIFNRFKFVGVIVPN